MNRTALWCILFRTGLALPFLLVGAATRATTVIPPDFAQLVNESDFVVRTVVKSVTASFQPTLSGGQKIITRVELEVREVIMGTPSQPLVLEMLGGRVGNRVMRVEGAPELKVGDEDILFVRDNGKSFYTLVAMMHGRYPIVKEAGTGREYIARSNRMPLRAASEVALPMTDSGAAKTRLPMASPVEALSPGDFARQIRAAVNPGYQRAPAK